MSEVAETLEITHKSGLHARASTLLVELARSFKSDVYVARGDNPAIEVDGKSIVGVMTLGAEMGHSIALRVIGKDAEKAMAALVDLVKRDFDGV